MHPHPNTVVAIPFFCLLPFRRQRPAGSRRGSVDLTLHSTPGLRTLNRRHNQSGGSGGKCHSGHKRKALLELLDQVGVWVWGLLVGMGQVVW